MELQEKEIQARKDGDVMRETISMALVTTVIARGRVAYTTPPCHRYYNDLKCYELLPTYSFDVHSESHEDRLKICELSTKYFTKDQLMVRIVLL